MMFPTAAYLQASQNAAEMEMRGQEALGKGIAGGISAASSAFKEYKEDQAKFDATKRLFKAFENYLPKQTDPITKKVTSPIADEIKAIFADTTISTREKIQMTPIVMSLLGNAQQQYGREAVAEIMADSRLDVVNAKNPPPKPRTPFNAAPKVDPLDDPVLPSGSSAANPQALQPQSQVGGASDVPYMIQRPPAQPQSVQQQPRGKLPKTRWNDKTGKMEFLSPQGTRYIEEPDDDLLFGADFRITPF